MRLVLIQFLVALFASMQIFAQQKLLTVQGHVRHDISQHEVQSTYYGDKLMEVQARQYSSFSFDSIKYWIGNGTNRAALVIDWYDGKGSQTAYVWGYRWPEGEVRTGFDMILHVANADERLIFLTHYTGSLGNTIAGLGYDLNNSGNQSLYFNNELTNPIYPINGVVTTDAYNYDNWSSSDPDDHWQSGWYSGFWSYQVKNIDDAAFTFSGFGASSRILENGAMDGWCYNDFSSSSGMGGTLPRMPFVYVQSPYPSFPQYTSYWGNIRKDVATHMPIVNTPLAIKQDSLIERWKLTGIGGMVSGGQMLIVNDDLYLVHNNKLKIIDRLTGNVITETTMAASAGFFSMMSYGEGKIFVPLAGGILQAFRADNLQSIWRTEAVSGKQHLCEVTYHDGYVYTGLWQSGMSGSTGTFYCVSAADDNPDSELEIKPRLWESSNTGYYWSGGTVVGNAIIFGGDKGMLESRDRLTGSLLDSIAITGTIRCGTSFDSITRHIYFTAKEEKRVYSVKVNSDGKFVRATLKWGQLTGQSTTVPVSYNNRLYVVSGTMTSGGGLDVFDATTLDKIYSVGLGGISQATPLICTGYANEFNNNTVYIYLTLNNSNGSIVCVKDFEGNTQPIIKYTLNPSTSQFCTHSLVADEDGSIYYKNDAGVLIAYTSKPSYEVYSVKLNLSQKDIPVGKNFQLTATVQPDNADNKEVTWESTNPAVATVDSTGLVTAVTVGEANIIVTTVDGSFKDTCVVNVVPFEYTEGVFIVNEDWFGHVNSTVNFLGDDGTWHYRIYQQANPGKELGCTSQYGSIYGDKFYIVSKQEKDQGASIVGSRFAVCNAKTMESLAEFTTIGGADGRSFLGVNEHKGYISTSNGVFVYDMDNMSIGNQVYGTENTTGNLYLAQTGTMIRVFDKVFAVHQEKGLLVIDIEKDSVVSILKAPKDGDQQRGYGSIVRSKDGTLWLSVSKNINGDGLTAQYMMKLNPYTMDTTRIILPLGAQIPNSWYAWTADGFCASTQNNKLYWKNDLDWFKADKIYEYDIDNDTIKLVFNSKTYEPTKRWNIYGAGFRIDPVTDEIYVSLFRDFTNRTYKVVKFNIETETVTGDYPMTKHHWFPAMPVFPDIEAPVVSWLTELSMGKDTVIYLGDKVSDADNMQVSIVKTLQLDADETLISASISNDSLYIVSHNTQLTPQTTSLTINFNSNGKLVSHTVQVTVAGRDPILATSVGLSESTLSLMATTTHQLTATVLPDNADNKSVTWESSAPSVATVDATGLVTAVTVGEANIIVTTVDGSFRDTCAVTVTPILVTSVSLSETALSLVATTTHQLTATVLPDNAHNKSVTWESSNAAVATVDAAGLVTAVTVGEANIIVTTVDGSFRDTCAVTVTPILVTSVSLSETTLSLMATTTHQLTATVLPDNAHNKSVTWESSNAAVATVDATGLVTAVTVGEANIVVTTVDGSFRDTCAVTVTPILVTSVIISQSTLLLEPETTQQLTATVLPDNAHNKSVTWESSNVAVATVDATGLVTAVNAGEANIIVTSEDGLFTDTCKVIVAPIAVLVTSVSLSETTLSLVATTTHQLSATVLPDNADNVGVTWSSTNPSVATVDATGLVTAVSLGEAKIIVTTVQGSFRDTCIVTVTPILVTSVSLSESALSLVATTTHQLTATVLPDNAHNKSVTWESSNAAVATVDATGLVTAVTVGEANIVVTTVDGSFRDTCAVTVTPILVTSVSLSETTLSLMATTTHQLTATVLPDNAHNKSVTWESSNAAVATVDATGLVIAVTVGEANIVVTTVDGSFRDTCVVTVTPILVTSVSLSETTLSLMATTTHQLTATVLPDNAHNKSVTWESSNAAVATVDATGLVTAVTVGEANIVVTTVDGSFRDTCVVTVTPILVTSVSLSETTLSLMATTTHQLTATVLPDNAHNKSVTWESSNAAVATVDATGLVTAVTVGEANIVVTTVDGSFRDTCAVTVTPILVTSVSLSETTLSLMATTTHQLTATVLPDNAHNKSVTWESSNAAVATVDATGLVTAVTVGEANIVVTTVDGSFRDTCAVTVTPILVTSVSLSETTLSLMATTTHQLTATVLPDNADNKSVTWESSNAAVATVDATGLVTAVTVGEANIVVTTVDGSFRDTCVVNVTQGVGVDLQVSSSIKVYPTITNGNVTIILDDYTSCDVQIIDLAGKVLKVSRLESKVSVIDISDLKSGMYILLINNQTFKIFKQ